MKVALNNIHAKNQNPKLEQELKNFTEAVLREASLSVQAKNDIVEQLSVLAAQVAMPEGSRIIASNIEDVSYEHCGQHRFDRTN